MQTQQRHGRLLSITAVRSYNIGSTVVSMPPTRMDVKSLHRVHTVRLRLSYDLNDKRQLNLHSINGQNVFSAR